MSTSAPQVSSKSPTIRRILREAAEISNAPSADYTAEPLESDLFEWHFTLRGPPNSVYSDGLYHGRIVLPPTYPLRPPSFRFTTPSGRFEANREICLSISGHHEETWQPAWGIRTAIVALRSFMETDAKGQLGGLEMPDTVRRRMAQESGAFKCPTCAKTNAEIIKECEDRSREASEPSEDVQVPKELNMGWRDEMEAKGTKTADNVQSSAELAEGFVQTTPVAPVPAPAVPLAVPQQPATPATPTTAVRHVPLPATHGPLDQDRNNGVPLWLDRAIVGLVILLAALVLRVLFGA
ncbi:ubiquitin-conjugating enzyme/RWD-like protein [Stachybotrys elegans]|uniref:Ubiquitin-conjugating enzyme/RWD-like protein n=1 Tax=Stachybotrys elegans TaxID=80388 RepID=A0A8K0SVF2_9HYPO|nr:ubiquitin-conjugating enzyme/RWD-like protein [Stachybotrys elegans]